MDFTVNTAVLRMALAHEQMTQRGWDAVAANLTDMAEERRASAQFYKQMFEVSAGMTAVGLLGTSLVGSVFNQQLKDLSSSPWMLPIGFMGALTLIGLTGRQWEVRKANQYDSDAAIASTQATLTSPGTGCGLITWLFYMLFGTPRQAVRYGHEFVDGQRRA